MANTANHTSFSLDEYEEPSKQTALQISEFILGEIGLAIYERAKDASHAIDACSGHFQPFKPRFGGFLLALMLSVTQFVVISVTAFPPLRKISFGVLVFDNATPKLTILLGLPIMT